MITTDFVTGSPSWLDLGAPDVPAAAAFYGAVFGWELKTMGPEAGGYGIFRLGGKAVAAVGQLTEEGARSAWMLYFQVPDADEAAATVQRLGGAVRMAPTGVEDEGRMAQFSDPQGGQFAVWQPGEFPGLEAVDLPDTLCWTELYSTDAAGAKEFYGGLFGWETQDIPLPGDGGTYSLIGPAGAGQERMHGGIMQLPAEALTLTGGRPYWHPVFAVTDCDASVAKVTENGGSVQMGPEDAEGVGRLAVCVDPSGADFVLLNPQPMPPAE
ncbi:VOC family protein [Streptomyces sp. GC420]|uniref:VOC family protein n=1 Tax=Streptomyces sp. GC420 TaxID=2697568 RepID=UPI0014151073|nr:VOC family protein [Streptomyces sp. GC420]NBM16849.1 VOC family protein [Streptomyces sp. GC420]